MLDKLDFDGLLQALDRLVQIPSLDGSVEERTVQEETAVLMQSLGLKVDTWEIDFPKLAQHPDYTAEVERDSGLGVLGSYGQGNGPSLILNGHTDVVAAGELGRWHFPPWRATYNPADGKVYGRGTLDMKGGLCCAIFAVKAIIDAGIQLKGRVTIQAVIGEEDGGAGTLAAVLQAPRADAAIIVEPTELTIAPAQAGAYNFRITIPGKAAHGAMRFEGVDPLEKFLLVYQAILDLEKVRNADVDHPLFASYPVPYPICAGKIQGGVWASTVMETLTFEGRYGVKIGEEPASAKKELEEWVQTAVQSDPWLRENPPVIEWWGAQFDPTEIPVTHEIVRETAASFQEISGKEPQLQGMPYGADMRLLVNVGGIPTIIFGPGDVRKAHQPDEHVSLADLKICTQTLALTILRFCQVAD
ncbi:ArgE/DapE family deacylase [Candidatus Leptofilum sp.]|uniref:ArgE/DapE family deacylase n=1 Tax=Candidatus Leptofilum sp. TaxID=3241576 RepID=UPI003B5BF171